MTTATALAIIIPLAVLFMALWTGIPLWLVFKHPDRGPEATRTVPAYRRTQPAQSAQPAALPAQAAQPTRAAQPAYAAARSWHVDRLEMPASR
jgi:hypothetical protein